MCAKRLLLALVVSCLSLLGATCVAAPSFSKGTSMAGAIAYQDASDVSQFWYLPTTTDVLLGQRLKTFRAIHFGFGQPYYIQDSKGDYRSASGGIVSGTFAYDISDKTRADLIAQITKEFGIATPKLLPLPLREPKIASTLLAKQFGQFGKVEQQLPNGIQIGADVAFSSGSISSLFAAVLALAQVGSEIQPNPTFSINVNAKAEFVGDPWTYDIDCDLSQVWHQVRKSAGGSVSYGFIKIGQLQYQGIWQDLQKANVCTFAQVEGSLDTAKEGRAIGETMKTIFQAINDAAVNQTGFFKFEPNPEAPPPGGGGGGGFNLFGWSISVNAGYSESFFNQQIKFHRRVTYTGRLEAPVAFSAVMAVACGDATKQLFSDLGDTTQSCITQEKINIFMDRAKRERSIKTKKLLELADDYQKNKITTEQYEKILALYENTDFTDTLVSSENLDSMFFGQPSIPGTAGVRAAQFTRELSNVQIDALRQRALNAPTVQRSLSEGIRLLDK
jgi:hypothetical protein